MRGQGKLADYMAQESEYFCPQCGEKEGVDIESAGSHTPHLCGCKKCGEPFYMPMGGPKQRKELLAGKTHNEVYWHTKKDTA